MIYYDNGNWRYNPWRPREIKNPNIIPKIPGVPVIPPLPEPEPHKEYAFQCGECGILVPNGAWGYSCPNQRCPIQHKVTC